MYTKRMHLVRVRTLLEYRPLGGYSIQWHAAPPRRRPLPAH